MSCVSAFRPNKILARAYRADEGVHIPGEHGVMVDDKVMMTMNLSAHAQSPRSMSAKLLCLLMSSMWLGALFYPSPTGGSAAS